MGWRCVGTNNLSDAFVGVLCAYVCSVGYGDIYPQTFVAQLCTLLYLSVAVIALADAASDVQMIGMRRRIRETDFSKLADECLLRDAVREKGRTNLDPVLSESEFLVDQLLANGLVDSDDVIEIRRQFRHLTRRGNFDRNEDRVLTTRMVYDEIRRRADSGRELSNGAELLDVVWRVKTRRGLKKRRGPGLQAFRWKSYEEWRDGSWQVRVMAKEQEVKEKAEEQSRGVVKTMGFRSV